MGLYYRPAILSSDPEKLDPYLASTNLVLPMDMYLYNYKNSENMDLITAWNPDEEQWWITGFNPECKEKTTLEIGRGFSFFISNKTKKSE